MSRVSQQKFMELAKERAKLINIDLSRDNLLDPIGKDRLADSYYMDGETSPQHRYAFVSAAFSSNLEHAQRLYEYSSNHWLGYSTPVLSFGRNKRGLPISCFADGTLVETKDGKTNIEDIKVGDFVLSSDGNYHEVINTQTSESDDLYELKVGEEVFHVTGNHLVLLTTGDWIRVDELDPVEHEIAQMKDVL